MTASFAATGYAIVDGVLADSECERVAALTAVPMPGVGTRNLLNHEWCVLLARRIREHAAIAARLVREGRRPLRAGTGRNA